MPVVITPRAVHGLWLDPAAQDREQLLAVLKPFPSAELVLFDVSPRVNSPSNNSPENIVPLLLSAE
jgi:putative SOS response-associated peptidase YedK